MDEAYAESFIHEPFEGSRRQIRLLQMLPTGGDDSSYLRFSIVTQLLKQVSDFIAISYTWGDKSCQYPIQINNKRFLIYGNCHEVLTNTYRQWKQGKLQSHLVWIDSICIDQGNSMEKTAQVSFMGDIYARATQVLAYVGCHQDDSEFLIGKAGEVAGFKYPCDHDDFLCEECRLPWENWALSLGYEVVTRLCRACETFGQRRYWTRVWIIQEIAKATSLWILCENNMLPWTCFSNLDEFLGLELEQLSSISESFEQVPSCAANQMHDVFATRRETIQLDKVFTDYSQYACGDARDHLYGLLGLVDWPKDVTPVTPDYDKSIVELVVQLAACIPFERIPDMLATFGITSKHRTIADMISRKYPESSTKDGEVQAEAMQESRLLYPPHENGRPALPLCGRLDVDWQGDLTTAVIEADEMDMVSTGSQGSEQLYFCIVPTEGTVYPDRSEESADAAISFLSSKFPTGHPKIIRFGSEIVGFACRETSKGDVIVPLSRRYNRVFLVLRQSHEDTFDVVGQAILLQEYRLGCPPDVDGEAPLPLFEAKVELAISATDAVLLFAQDADGSKDSYDHQDRWRRAVTPVYSGAARVTKQTHFFAKEVLARKRRTKDRHMIESCFGPIGPNTSELSATDGTDAMDSIMNLPYDAPEGVAEL